MTSSATARRVSEGKIGKYRWLVLATCCMVNCLSWGTLYSCGVLYSAWSHAFPNDSKAFISLVGALPVAVSCGLGPLIGMIITRFGYRSACVLGGLLMSVGWILSALMSDMIGLLVTFGIVTGFGAGLANFAGSTALNDYFVHDRVLAEGFHGSSLCLGMFIFTELLQNLAEAYSWQGAMLIAGGIQLNCCVLGLFLTTPEQSLTHHLNLWRRGVDDVTQDADDVVQGSYDEPEERKKFTEDENGNEMLMMIIESSDPEISVVEGSNEDQICRLDDDEILLTSEEEKVLAVEKEDESQMRKTKRGGMSEYIRTSMRLWRRSTFILLLISDLLSWIASFIPFVHLVERARLLDIDEDLSAWINSGTGIGGAVGRLALSFFFQKINIHPFYAYGITQCLAGLVTIASPFWSTVEGLFAYSIMFGLLSGGYGFIRATVAQMLGKENYSVAFSWFLMLEGFGIAFGPSLGGYLYTSTKSYTWTFIFSGSLIFISGAMCVWKDPIMSCDVSRKPPGRVANSKV